MSVALAVRARANCIGNRVGAVLALHERVISTGYNGTPGDMKNCDEGGCDRCEHRERYGQGRGYDLCVCVHAEQNTLLSAARFGISVDGSMLYTTMRPCFGCTKELLQTGVKGVRYLHPWEYPDVDLRVEYERIQTRFTAGVKQVLIEDLQVEWAVSAARKFDPSSHTG